MKKNTHLWGSFNETDNTLLIGKEDYGGAEDLVDRAMIKTIQTGGEVFLLDTEKMPANTELAAIFRY